MFDPYLHPAVTVHERPKQHYITDPVGGVYQPTPNGNFEVLKHPTLLHVLDQFPKAQSMCVKQATLTDESHAVFAKKLPELGVLQLDDCRLNSVGLNALVGNLPKLRMLGVVGSNGSDDKLATSVLTPCAALKDRKLDLLDLSHYPARTGIFNLIKGVGEIGRLVLSARDYTLAELDQALSERNVKCLEIAGSWRLANESTDGLSNLKAVPFVHVTGLAYIDNAELEFIAKAFGAGLTVLTVKDSEKIDAAGLLNIAEHCPNLRVLALYDCVQIVHRSGINSTAFETAIFALANDTKLSTVLVGRDMNGMLDAARAIVDKAAQQLRREITTADSGESTHFLAH